MVLTGGNGVEGRVNDAWEYDGTAWTQLDTLGAYTARVLGLHAWPPDPGMIVMFGGNDYQATRDDTWTLVWEPTE